MGAVLAVRVVGQGLPGTVILDVEGLTVQAELPPEGALPGAFQARVIDTGANIVLEIPTPQSNHTVNAAVFQLLPRQSGVPSFLHDLITLVRQPAVNQLPMDVQIALETMSKLLLSRDQLAAGPGLKQAIENSGLFFEAHLAEQVAEPTRQFSWLDWKAGLFRLNHALAPYVSKMALPMNTGAKENLPLLRHLPLIPQSRIDIEKKTGDDLPGQLGHLRMSTNGLLARLEIAQLQAGLEGVNLGWMIELPVRSEDHADVIQLRVERDPEGLFDSDSSSSWRVEFSLDLPKLGPLHGEVRLAHTKVSVILWADTSETVSRLENEWPLLVHQLGEAGLLIGTLVCRLGSPVSRDIQRVGLLSALA